MPVEPKGEPGPHEPRRARLNELLPGFTIAERGGVVRIAELQAQGYVYLRP